MQFQQLREPLINQDESTRIRENILNTQITSMTERQDRIKVGGVKAGKLNNVLEKYQQIGEKKTENVELYPSSENNNLISSYMNNISDSDYYYKSTAAHQLPSTNLLSFTFLQNNPSIFATMSKASDLWKDIDLKEFMCYEDYYKLTKIRIRNYIYLLRAITEVYNEKDEDEKNQGDKKEGATVYSEVKTKLLQIRKLCEFLSLTDYKEYRVLFERLYQNQPIYDLDDDNEPINMKEDSGYDTYNDEDAEFLNFFARSSLSDYLSDRSFYQKLLKEEEKWAMRAKFIEDKIDKIRQSATLRKSGWVSWLQAKLDTLADLDVPIKNTSSTTSNQVFYLYQFLNDYFQDKATLITPKEQQSYSKDQQVYIDQPNLYPKVKFEFDISNYDNALKKSWFSLREKLCLRIQKQELETGYFLTVFERKPFGNEKIYEKRINTRGHDAYVKRFEFHPTEKYLLATLKVKNDEYMDFIFPYEAIYKNPLVIKPGQEFLCFNGKNCYTVEKTNIKYPIKKKEEAIVQEDKVEGVEGAQDTAGQDPNLQVQQTPSEAENLQPSIIGGPVESALAADPNKTTEGNLAIDDKADDKDDNLSQRGNDTQQGVDYEEKRGYRLYQYDLYDFDKISTYDLFFIDESCINNGLNVSTLMQNKRFGKTEQNGWYFFNYKKNAEADKQFQLEINFQGKQYPIEGLNEKFEDASGLSHILNERGDRLLLCYKKDDKYYFQRYICTKEHKFIKDAERPEMKVAKEYIDTLEADKVNYIATAFQQDFILMIKDKSNKVTIYQNENTVIAFESQLENIKLVSNGNNIQYIYILESNNADQITNNELRYEVIQPVGDKKELQRTSVSFEMINRHRCVCFPYVFFLYNHDQVYMKDLTMPNKTGYYYLNQFLGIDKTERPLTLHGFVYNNKIQLNVPVVNSSNYNNNEFVLKVHQIKTFQYSTTPFKFNGVIRYRVYAINHECQKNFGMYAKVITDAASTLYNDIRIFSRNNCMFVERWEKNRCVARLMATNYNEPEDPQNREVTSQSITNINYKQRGFWLIIYQQGEVIQAFTREMRYNFHISELLGMEPVWDYSDEDQSNQVYNIFIDPLVKNKVDIYLLFQNGTMRKYSSPIPLYSNGKKLMFEEHVNIYSLETVLNLKGAGQQGGSGGDGKSGGAVATTSKKVNLFEQRQIEMFIANEIFYSTQKVIDLKAEQIENKYQSGIPIEAHIHTSQARKLTFSFNEAKLAAIFGSNDNDQVLLISPLINSRAAPQFYHRQFKHPVVPIVDQEKAITSVFTLNLDPIYMKESAYWGDYYVYCSYEMNKRNLWQDHFNVYPGILVKHFNGLEQKIPMKDKFIEVNRVVPSRDGKYILIFGIKLTQIDNQRQEEEKFQDGIFVYEMTNTEMRQIQHIQFAIKKSGSEPAEVRERLNVGQDKIRYIASYTDPEIQGLQIGEYTNDSYQLQIYNIARGYWSDINYNDESYQKYDDEYKEYLVKLQQLEEQLQKSKEVVSKDKDKQTNAELAKSQMNISRQDENNKSMHAGDASQAPPVVEEKKNPLVEIKRLKDNESLFPNFDIPYLPEKSSYFKDNYNRIKETYRVRIENPNYNNEVYQYSYEKKFENRWDPEETERINNIHKNMHVFVNENGHIFMINRLQNKLYFFYQKSKEDPKYHCHSFKFEQREAVQPNKEKGINPTQDEKEREPFKITSADSSGNYLLVYSNSRFMVIDITPLFSNDTIYTYKTKYELDLLRTKHQDLDTTKKNIVDKLKSKVVNYETYYFVEETQQDKKINDIIKYKEFKVVHDSRRDEKVKSNAAAIKDDKEDSMKYQYVIQDIKIIDNVLLMKLKEKDDSVSYFKVFQFIDKITIHYIECNRLLISGNKEFIWLMDEGQVFDIARGFTTFFFWPGNQINTHAYDHMDLFNVNKDRTIMSTPGILQLSFDLISHRIHNNSGECIKYDKIPNFFLYKCYKLMNCDSVLNRIFSGPFQDLEVVEEDHRFGQRLIKRGGNENTEADINQLDALTTFTDYLVETFDMEKNDSTYITCFFLQYYNERKQDEKYVYTDMKDQRMRYHNIFQKMFSYNEIRYDLIEEILRYIAQCSTIPLIQPAVNTCFTQFLETANSSQAFQTYLNNVTKSTSQMKKIEKFQIVTKEEERYVVASHDSPILDDRFYSEQWKQQVSKKDVEITYVTLGYLLSQQGSTIMEQLSDKKYLKIMDNPFISYLVMFQWNKVKNEIKKRLLYPFFALLILFTIYSVYFVDYKAEVEDTLVIEDTSSTTESSDTTTTDSALLSLSVIGGVTETVSTLVYILFYWSNMVLLFTTLCYFFFIEGKQLLKSPREYFTSFWNLADLLNYSLCMLVLIADIGNLDKRVKRPVAAVCLIVLWVKMFYFLRVFDSTSKLIRMIIEIVNDMKTFLIVLIIGILGFTGGLYILQQGLYTVPSEENDYDDGLFVGDDPFQAFIYTYRLSLGDFQLDSFNTFADIGLAFEYYLIWLIFILGSLFLVIVLLNLLIAIMGDTFSKVLESIQNLAIREKVMLIAENEALFDRNTLFLRSQFLIIINEKQLEGAQGDSWDGQINALRRQVMDKVTRMENGLKSMINESQKDLKKRFIDQEEKQKKNATATDQKFQGTLKNQFGEALVSIKDMFDKQQDQINKIQQQVFGFQEQLKVANKTQSQVDSLKEDIGRLASNLYKEFKIHKPVDFEGGEEE